MEIVNQHREPLDAIFVPVGGGGLVAGVAAYVKYLHPQIKIIGVEAQGSNCLDAAMRAGRRVRLPIDQLDLFADGVSVTQIGKETFKVAKKYVDDVVVVNVDEICAAIKDVFEDTRCVAEPAGALAIAGMKRYVDAHPGMSHVVSIVSGANVNFDRLRHISERAEVGEAREAVLAVTIDEAKGSFLKFCRALGKRAITEFNYRCADSEQAHIYVGIGVKSKEDRIALVAQLESKGYRVFDMTENEAAKVHVRHMVGGHRGSPGPEMLFDLSFLSGLGHCCSFCQAWVSIGTSHCSTTAITDPPGEESLWASTRALPSLSNCRRICSVLGIDSGQSKITLPTICSCANASQQTWLALLVWLLLMR